MPQEYIRNFCIVAHVDHGKSTLADRLMELTKTIEMRDMVEQTLDSHPISRERGITIKLAPVVMEYPSAGGQSYQLNLIDTPGHVDFSYEVERSLAACEGAILLVDATQGIQAQTLSHFQKANKLGLKVIPAINKIDSPIANVLGALEEIKATFGFMDEDIFRISARTGEGVKELLEAVVKFIPGPQGKEEAALRGLVFSSQFDPMRGVTAFVRIVDGEITGQDRVFFMATQREAAVLELGHFKPGMVGSKKVATGEVGYVVTNVKDPAVVKVGDTITINEPGKGLPTPLPGYREPQPMVFVSLFPVDQNEFSELSEGLKKLKLNDAAITFSITSSKALGRGWRCGFLGHLHAEVSQERLEADFGLNIIATIPSVEYKTQGEQMLEPWVEAKIITPQEYVGAVINLAEDRRGKLLDTVYHGKTVTISYELPLAEIISDFFDQLKSATSGYASVDYEVTEFRPFEAVTLEILLNHEAIDAFSQTLEKTRAEKFGRFIVEKLKDLIPRQQIAFPIQASINGQIVARADVAAFRKDVTAKLYGGDVTRKMKLLEKQREGKKKMKMIGKVEIPSDTFLKVFKS